MLVLLAGILSSLSPSLLHERFSPRARTGGGGGGGAGVAPLLSLMLLLLLVLLLLLSLLCGGCEVATDTGNADAALRRSNSRLRVVQALSQALCPRWWQAPQRARAGSSATLHCRVSCWPEQWAQYCESWHAVATWPYRWHLKHCLT